MQIPIVLKGKIDSSVISRPGAKPDYPGPHSYLIAAVVFAALCAFFNILSLACGVPAIVLAGLVNFLILCYS